MAKGNPLADWGGVAGLGLGAGLALFGSLIGTYLMKHKEKKMTHMERCFVSLMAEVCTKLEEALADNDKLREESNRLNTEAAKVATTVARLNAELAALRLQNKQLTEEAAAVVAAPKRRRPYERAAR